MAEALALVKRELGPGAVILHARTYKQGGFWGIGARKVVEITASDGGRAGRQKPPAKPKLQPVDPVAGDLIRRTYAAAQAELSRQQALAAPAAFSGPVASPAVVAPSAPPVAMPLSDLTQEMRAVKQMVAQLMQKQERKPAAAKAGWSGKAARPSDLHPSLFDQYLCLLEREVTEELAEEVIQEVRRALPETELGNTLTVRRAVLEAIGRFIPVDAEAGAVRRPTDGRPLTVLLVGPTGVGKTTTLAKLAATFKLKQKKKVGLITLDTYRIAAVDQLRTYANIIGVPLHVAANPEELTAVLSRCGSCDVVLIDSAGRSPRDEPRLEQLRRFCQAANPHEVHLVLASTCSEPALLEAVERFSTIRTDRIIFTKLDEAVSFGVLLNVAKKVNKRLSYVTTGQEVPHDIEPSRPSRLAALVMGGCLEESC